MSPFDSSVVQIGKQGIYVYIIVLNCINPKKLTDSLDKEYILHKSHSAYKTDYIKRCTGDIYLSIEWKSEKKLLLWFFQTLGQITKIFLKNLMCWDLL